MWILRFECIGADGTKVNYSCCLKQAVRYDIGRSTKTPLHIKNDKSISRSHIQLEVDGHDALTVINVGKLTKLNGEVVKVGYSARFSPGAKAMLEMGASPIVASVSHESALWKIPHDISMVDTVKQRLALYGIDAVATLSPKTSIQVIKQRPGKYGNCLFSLLAGIPVLRETFIDSFLQQFDHVHTNFDEKCSELKIQNSQFPNYIFRPSIFQGLDFVVTSRKVFAIFKHIVDAGNGTLWLCDGVSNLGTFIKLHVRSDKIVTLVHLNDSTSPLPEQELQGLNELQEARNLKVEAKSLGLKIYDVNDIVNAVLNNDIKSLLQRIPVEKICSTSSGLGSFDVSGSANLDSQFQSATAAGELTVNPTSRKRRANRHRVQPLNSLTFFGGGSIASQEVKSTVEDSNSNKPRIVTEPPVSSNSEEIPLSKKPRLEPQCMVEDLPSSSRKTEDTPTTKRAHEKPSEQHEGSADAKRPRISDLKNSEYVASKQAAQEAIHANENVQQISELPKAIPAIVTSADAGGKDTFEAPNNTLRSDKRSVSFVRAIQEAKSHEVDRLREKMADVQGEELTEEAIMQLDNLAIVEAKNLLRPRNSIQGTPVTNNNELWSGRKDFKKFVKIWPSQYARSSPDPASDAIRNKACLITRDYVPMQPYNPRRASPPVDDMVPELGEASDMRSVAEDGIDLGVRVEDDEPIFEFTSQRQNSQASHFANDNSRPRNNQELFVVDEDDSQQLPDTGVSDKNSAREDSRLITSKPTSIPVKSHKSRKNDDDNDDSDDEPRFQFLSRRR
ncbi:LAME_0D02960g1_1 [Lachancea meyersii CBS 8951]|uniref:LAME_0D02960g1_1 n=1 Tax=Lachancea meyersii CBS 8951 TaxID=1266667 RepID=A0A1G4J7Y6_9SACH|nr:LAME_0D02960g1_1 [Lachancea meyersii CBS 8951]